MIGAMRAIASPTGRLTLPTDEVLVSEGLTSGDWLRAGLIVVGAIAVAVVTSRVTRTVLQRTVGDGFAAVIISRFVGYLLFLVGLIYALNALGIRVGPLLGALGLGGLVLALALQNVAENFVGGVILQSRRPFTVGDTVELDEHVGVVVDIDSRTTVLRGLDGSHIRLPNANVLGAPIVNLTREGLRRSELAVGVAYDSNLERATAVLVEAVGRVPRISRTPAPWVMLRQFGASSIDLTIYYWHRSDVPSELAATHDLILAVHHGLADAGITIAFPQMVVWAGHDATDNPYDERPALVHTDREAEGVRPPAEGPGRGPGSRWRLRRRR